MLIQRSFDAQNPRGAMWIVIGDIPSQEDVWPPQANYDAVSGMGTMDVSIEPEPNEAVKAAFAEQIGQLVGVDSLSVEWGLRDEPDGRKAEWPVARVSFGDERGWDKERVFGMLNAAQILGQSTLAGLY